MCVGCQTLFNHTISCETHGYAHILSNDILFDDIISHQTSFDDIYYKEARGCVRGSSNFV